MAAVEVIEVVLENTVVRPVCHAVPGIDVIVVLPSLMVRLVKVLLTADVDFR